MAELRTTNLKDVTPRPGFQHRILGLDEDTVLQYMKAMKDGDQFPPIVVYEINEMLYLVDGFHRFESATRLKWETIEAEVHQGTFQEAEDYSRFKANRKNGMRMSRADIQEIIREMVYEERFVNMSSRGIADIVGVAPGTVIKIRKELDMMPDTVLNARGQRVRSQIEVERQEYERKERERELCDKYKAKIKQMSDDAFRRFYESQ